jgi:hypothetical protein
MKKIVVIALLLVYGLSSSGATIHLHFCCGKLDDISFSSTGPKSCSIKTFSSSDCCKSKHVELKVKADQEPGTKWLATNKVNTKFLYPVVYTGLPAFVKSYTNEFATGPPVKALTVPLFIQYCVYRL